MTIFIFEIHQLKLNVVQHISNHDLFNCTLVSKQWFSCFNPSLWESINTKIIGEKSVALALFQYHTYVQSVTTTTRPIKTAIPVFPNLRSLECYFARFHLYELNLIHLMSSCSLRNLKLTMYYPTTDHLCTITRLIKLQPNLVHLDLTIREAFENRFIIFIMEMLPNLHTLRLSFFENPKSAESQSQDIQQKPTQDEISRIQDLGLRVLTVAFTTVPQQISVLNILLQHCPLLESLEICGLRDSGVMEHIIQLFQKNHFPYLKHFNIANLKSSDIEGEIVSKMIQGLGLYQNEDNGVRQHERIHPCRLEAFKILKFEKFTWSSAHSLLDYHKDTLTELEISPNHSIQFALFSLIASSLPNLVSMNVDVWIGPGSGSTSHDLESMDIAIKSNWKCLGLKRLLLSTMYRHEETWRSVVEECANQLFNQIAKLSRLREWSFVGSIDLLVASCPYLSKLSSLKELRSLTLNVDLDFPLGKEEAEWMLENWSKLIHVESIENPWDDELISPGPQYGHFEKTLLSQRPWLQITNRME